MISWISQTDSGKARRDPQLSHRDSLRGQAFVSVRGGPSLSVSLRNGAFSTTGVITHDRHRRNWEKSREKSANSRETAFASM